LAHQDTLTRMQAFVDIVEQQGFSAAARKVGRSKALMSKYVRELEDELGILLRISAPRSLTDLEIGLPIVEFASAYPDITIDMNLDDAMVDMVEEGYDVAIRISRLTDSALIAKKLSDFRLVLCATPEFIKIHGTPKSPNDLGDLPCIVDTNLMRRANWCFLDDDGQEISVPVRGNIEVNSPEVARRAALAGLGMTLVPEFSIENELKSGALVSLLEDRIPSGGGIYAVYPHRRHVPGKVRVFVDFLAQWFKTKSKSEL